MISDYINAALRKAKYEILDDEPYYAEIVELQGVWATGHTFEECRSNLIEVIESMILA